MFGVCLCWSSNGRCMEFSWHLLGVLPSVWGCEVWLAFSWDLLLLWYFDNCSSALWLVYNFAQTNSFNLFSAMPLRIVQQQQTKKKHKRRRNSKINKKKNNKSKRTKKKSAKRRTKTQQKKNKKLKNQQIEQETKKKQ